MPPEDSFFSRTIQPPEDEPIEPDLSLISLLPECPGEAVLDEAVTDSDSDEAP